MNLTEDEQKLVDSVERGEWQSVPDVERSRTLPRGRSRHLAERQARHHQDVRT